MRYRMLFVLLPAIALGAFRNLSGQIEVAINDGTNINTTIGLSTSYGTWCKNFHQQDICRMSEIGNFGRELDTSILSFLSHGLSTCSLKMPNHIIRFKHTTMSNNHRTLITKTTGDMCPEKLHLTHNKQYI